MRVRLPLLGLLTTSLAVMTHACVIGPDECTASESACDGNVANRCIRRGVELNSEINREDCGDSKVCLMAVDVRSPYINDARTSPGCVRKEVPTCATAGEFTCNGDTFAACADLTDGRRAWVEYPCLKGCRDGRCVAVP
jgi:hypothetical protein